MKLRARGLQLQAGRGVRRIGLVERAVIVRGTTAAAESGGKDPKVQHAYVRSSLWCGLPPLGHQALSARLQRCRDGERRRRTTGAAERQGPLGETPGFRVVGRLTSGHLRRESGVWALAAIDSLEIPKDVTVPPTLSVDDQLACGLPAEFSRRLTWASPLPGESSPTPSTHRLNACIRRRFS